MFNGETPGHRLIREKIQRCLDEITELKSHWNSLAPVSRLPPEILSKIFAMHVSQYVRPPANKESDVGPSYWFNFSRVCQYWRMVSLGSAELWNTITFRADSSCVSLMLSRTKQTQLTITVPMPKEKFFAADKQRILETVLDKEMSRITWLEMPLHLGIENVGSAEVLRTLILDGTRGQARVEAFSDILHGAGSSTLEYLELNEVSLFRWNPVTYRPHLTNFIFSCHNISKPLRLNDLISALKGMPLLEVFHLYHSLLEDIQPSWSLSSVVSLPNLQSIRLRSGDMVSCANLLTWLDLPRARDVRFEGLYLRNRSVLEPTTMVTHLRDLSHACTYHVKENGSTTDNGVESGTKLVKIVLWGVNDGTLSVLAGKGVYPRRLHMALSLYDFMPKILPLSHVKILTLRGYDTQECLLALLKHMRSVQQLNIYSGSVMHILGTLFQPIEPTSDMDATHGAPILPHLYSLHFHRINFPISQAVPELQKLADQVMRGLHLGQRRRVSIKVMSYSNCANLTVYIFSLLRQVTGTTNIMPCFEDTDDVDNIAS